jgi:hypothetical protein
MTRLSTAWRAMGSERRTAALAAVGLLVTMFFPWYQQNAVVDTPRSAPLQSRNLDAFQVFSFVEAAVLLVSLAVCYLLFARAEGRDFQMPGGDGTVVLAAGLWTALLLVFRLFDKPGVTAHGVAANVGVQWGIFFALAAAGLLAYSGQRMRPSHRAPPALRHARPGGPGGEPEPPTREEARERGGDGEEGSRIVERKARRQGPERPAFPPAPATAATRAPQRRERARTLEAPEPEQLSFEEEQPPASD